LYNASMVIKTFILGELQTNCYLVYDGTTKQGVIIDPADEANFISEQVLKLKIKPEAIVATHGHFDHILASWELQLAFNIPFLIHKRDIPIVNYMQKSAGWWLKKKIIEKSPEKIKTIKEKDEIKFGKKKLKVVYTPGHSPGGICLYSPSDNLLFSGDTLFANAAGRTDFHYGSPKELASSLKKLSSLPANTTIYPGHGPSSFLKDALKKVSF